MNAPTITDHDDPERALYISDATLLEQSAEAILNEDPAETWPDPQPLPTGLPPVMPFNLDMLPQSLRPWVADIAERMQCAVDFVAVTVMVAAGILIGRKVGIRPKRHDSGWTVICNLWGMIIGRPSLLKSPAMKEGMAPLQRLEIEAKNAHADAELEHETTRMVNDARRKALQGELREAVKAKQDTARITAELTELAATDSPAQRKRYLTSNTSPEKCGEILRANPNGIGLYVDEVVGHLRSMDKEGNEQARSFYLTAWMGDSRYTYDRIGRGTVDIEGACVSIIGATQPGVIAEYLQQAVAGGKGNDGLVQRFQMSVWPDVSAKWRHVDRYPDSTAKAGAFEVFCKLDKLTADDCLAHTDQFSDVKFLNFDETAQPLFDEWWCGLERRLRRGSLHPAIEDHLAKFRSLVPSLALILHLADGKAGPIGSEYLAKAIFWAEYLESHAMRIYSSVIDSSALAARELARRIQAGDVVDMFTARDVYRHHWQSLDRESTRDAIDTLVSLHWIEEREEHQATGRPKVRYAINPKIGKRGGGVVPKVSKATSGTYGTGRPGALNEFQPATDPSGEAE